MSVKESLKKIRPLRYIVHLPGDIVSVIRYKRRIRLLKKEHVKKGVDFVQFKDAYKGKRCFVVGLGPSLRTDDLDKLQEEICFSSNRIFQIYEKTRWRPTFYCSGDPNFARNIGKNLIKIAENSRYVILNLAHLHSYDTAVHNKDNVFFYKTIVGTGFDSINKEYGKFPEKIDMAKELDSVGTITYEILEMAIYMGFSEIYLLGVDHNYSGNDNNYMKGMSSLSEDDKVRITNTLSTERWTDGFMNIERIAKRHGIEVYNATRGGALEVFKRVDFDKIIRDFSHE